MGFNSGFKGLKYSVLIVVEKNTYKIQHLEGSGTPVLYIGRTVFKGECRQKFPKCEIKLDVRQFRASSYDFN